LFEAKKSINELKKKVEHLNQLKLVEDDMQKLREEFNWASVSRITLFIILLA